MHESNKKVLLLVEDEAILAMTEKMTLEKYGYTVITANTGEKAVETVEKNPGIDLVLMDIDLGKGIDGTEAGAIILSRHDIPIVFLSSHTESDIVEKTEKITSYGYVVKNSSITVLDASIKMAFKLFYANRKTEESEHRYKFLANNVPDIIYSLDKNGMIESVNYQSFEKYGYKEMDITGKSFIDFVHPEDRELLMKSFMSCMQEKRVNTSGLQFRLTAADGKDIWIELNANSSFDGKGMYLGEHGVLRDITESRKTGETLRESEERFQMLFDNAPLGYQSLDIDGRFLEVNRQWLDTLGYAREEVIGKWFGDFLSPVYQEGFRKRFPIFKAQGHIHSEFEMVRKNGNKLFIAFDGRIGHESDGTFKQTHCILQDITERKKEEQLLKLSRERHAFALEGNGLGEWDWDLKSGSILRNERWAETLGYTLADLSGDIQQGIDLQHPDDRAVSWNAIQEHLAGRTDSFNITYRMRAKDGTYKWIHDCGKIMERDEQGNPVRVCGTHGNIDEQVRAGESLRTSNALLTSIIESSPDIIVFALNTDYKYLAFNTKHKEAIRQIWGKTIEIGMNMLDIIGNQADRIAAQNNFDRALSGEHFVLLEEYGDESLSRISWVDYWSPIRDAHDAITGLTCFVLNNTEQKTAELKIKNLLDEKELLLKEVHHRIKNNMTTISGLLLLQAESATDPSIQDSLRDAGSRVMSMQILYDKLYRSSDARQLGLAAYLDPLTDEILSNFPDRNRVRITKQFDDIILGVKVLQPLGIIINELLTNIMKYAFTGRSEGTISISAASKEKNVLITVADDGNGIPESVSFEHSTGFGLVLVNGLTQQLGGTIRIERGEGTKIVLEFPV